MSQLSKAWRNSRLYARLRAKRLPKLLVIGAQKSGTSALFSYLAQHPRLEPSLYKELDFFGSDLRFGWGLDWYAAQWDRQSTRRRLRFDVSPLYMLAPRSAGRIRQCLPQVKMVAVLRDPVQRAYSAWQMYRRQLAEDPNFYRTLIRNHYSPEEQDRFDVRTNAEANDFELAVTREIETLQRGRSMEWSVVELGLYGPQLARYFELFPRNQLLVCDSHELRTNRIVVLNQILRLIGLPNWNWTGANLDDVFVGQTQGPITWGARDQLCDYYRESNAMLSEMLPDPPQFVRDMESSRQAA
jgi:hypothetical protein